MARMEAVGRRKPGAKAQLILERSKARLGRVPAGAKIRAGLPGFLEATAGMDRFFRGPKELPPRIFRLAMLKTAALAGCPF